MTTTTKVILGILGAAAAGVIMGMMISPEKGEAMGRKIKDTADDLVDEVSSWVGKGKHYLADAKDKAVNEAEHLKDEAKDAYQDVKSTVKKNINV